MIDHIIVAILIQLIVRFISGSWAAGAAAAFTWFLSREIAQGGVSLDRAVRRRASREYALVGRARSARLAEARSMARLDGADRRLRCSRRRGAQDEAIGSR